MKRLTRLREPMTTKNKIVTMTPKEAKEATDKAIRAIREMSAEELLKQAELYGVVKKIKKK